MNDTELPTAQAGEGESPFPPVEPPDWKRAGEALTPPRLQRFGSVAAHVGETLQTLLTGLILAFIFRAFLVEPFVIPSGSMADSLLGAHATRTCPVCGWEFDFASKRPTSPSGAGFVVPNQIVCPNCETRFIPTPQDTVPKAGDRLLVHKWTYALGGALRPQRWDVIVFRDPADPEQHFIKRLVALPGESIELVDGDVFINGQVARKPPEAQESLWFIVFDQAHLPAPVDSATPVPRWVAADPPPSENRGWHGMDTRVIRYDALDSVPRIIAFNPDTGREYLMDLYAYNGDDHRTAQVFVDDVRIVSELTLRAGDGWCRWEIARPPYRFFADLHPDGRLVLGMESPDQPGVERTVRSVQHAPFALGRPIAIEFAHLDYRAYLKIDGRELLWTDDADYPRTPQVRRGIPDSRPVGLRVAAADLRLELRGLRIDRDVYYTPASDRTRRAAPGHPFVLGDDEYFVLGDNSPDSHDSREWTEVGPHLPPDHRPGTVPGDQIVGHAAFVYLPGLQPVEIGIRWLVPDLGRVRFVR